MDPLPADDLSQDLLAATIRGRWHVRASTCAAWLSGSRDSPVYSNEVISEDPLVVKSNTSWIDLNGNEKHQFGTSHWKGDHFVLRHSRFFPIRVRENWKALGASTDGNIMVLRFDRLLGSKGGVDVVVRDDVEVDNLHTVISRSPGGFGLTAEEFANLGWMAPTDNR